MLNDQRWEKFRGGPANGRSGKRSVRITLNRRGVLYLNDTAYHAIGRPKAVSLYYSHDDRAILVERTSERGNEAFFVVKKQIGWCIHASSFARHFGLKIPTTIRFLRPDFDNDGNLVLDLNEVVNVGLK